MELRAARFLSVRASVDVTADSPARRAEGTPLLLQSDTQRVIRVAPTVSAAMSFWESAKAGAR